LYKEIAKRKKQSAGDSHSLSDATAGTNFFNPKEVDFFKINLPKARARGLKKIFPGAMADRPGEPCKKILPCKKFLHPL
jgi:hypothetical protein